MRKNYWNISAQFLLPFISKYQRLQINKIEQESDTLNFKCFKYLLSYPAQISNLTIWNLDLLRRCMSKNHWSISAQFLLPFISKHQRLQINKIEQRSDTLNFKSLLSNPAQISNLTIWKLELLRRCMCKNHWSISAQFLLPFISKHQRLQINKIEQQSDT